MTQTHCAACGGTELALKLRVRGDAGPAGLIPTTDRFGTALGDIVGCRRCGHGQVEPMPDAATLNAAYVAAASDDYVAEEAGQRETARRWLDRLEAHLPARGRMLDVGTWVGFLLAEAQSRGWRGVGLEPSTFGADHARRLGLDVRQADLAEAPLPAGGFDLVTMNDVIEHLPQPGQALDRVASLLGAGGVLGMVLPDAGSLVARGLGRRWWSVIPTHVQYFTRRSVVTLLGRHGFEVVEISTAPKVFTVDYYLSRVGGYSPGLERRLRQAGRAAGAAERLWAPDFRDRMAVIARPR